MATKKVATRTPTGKKSIAATRLENQKLKAQVDKIRFGSYCYMCGEVKTIDHFYVDYDPNVTNNRKETGVSACRICKQCFQGLIHGNLHGGPKQRVTKNSLKKGLYYLNKPFIDDVYDSAVASVNNKATGGASDIGQAYMTQINSLQQYRGTTWLDSDLFKTINGGQTLVKDDEEPLTEQEVIEGHMGEDVYDSFVKNRNDVQRLLGYDPFEKEAIEDQPFLYSQLLGILDSDEESSEDMMRVSSAITIVRGFLQEAKLDDAITKLMGNTEAVADNSATIKSLQDSKQKITSMITQLAAESCLSLKNSKVQTKASVTWSGKIAKIKDLNLREGEVNGFDINTCRGMQQVQQISDASIMRQLALDESEWSDMVAEMRERNRRLQKEKDSYKELNRILLRENLDLKDTMEEKGIPVESEEKPLGELYSVFRDSDNGVDFEGQEGETNELDNATV